jgi:hypothetical protein
MNWSPAYLAVFVATNLLGVMVGYRWQPAIKRHLVDKYLWPPHSSRGGSARAVMSPGLVLTAGYWLVLGFISGGFFGYTLRVFTDKVVDPPPEA